MRSSALVLLLMLTARLAHAQAGADATAPEAPADATAPVEAAPAPTAPVEAAPAPAADPNTEVERRKLYPVGLFVGLEAGYGMPTGTTQTVYGAGRGTGLVVGLFSGRFALEWHLLQHYGLQPKEDQLRGETTVGTLSMQSVMLRARVLDLPLVEVMAGGAMMATPIYVVGVDGENNQEVQSSSTRGVGVIAGASAGYSLTKTIDVTLELRAVIASRWELPGRAYVVPGAKAPDGGIMFTTSTDDPTGTPRTATVLFRIRFR